MVWLVWLSWLSWLRILDFDENRGLSGSSILKHNVVAQKDLAPCFKPLTIIIPR
jgi:hypothetical protein